MLGDRIKKLRENKELSQKQLADMLSVGPSTISMWEQGRRAPDNEMLSKIADFFDVTTDYLLGRTDNPNLKIVEANLNGHHYKIGINKNYPHDLTPEEVEFLIEQLEESGFNIDKLIEKAKNKNNKK